MHKQLVFGICLPLVTAIAQAQPVSEYMLNLGDLTTNQQGVSYARAVSADGSTAVGEASYDLTAGGRSSHAFRWTSAGMQSLGDLTTNQQGYSNATAVSADGSTVVGISEYDKTAGGVGRHAFRWTRAGMQSLGDLTTNQQGYSDATAVSADGSIVVGKTNYNTTPGGGIASHAYRWANGIMQDLGDLTTNQQGYSDATAVSADGSTVVGRADYDRTAGGTGSHAFRWTSAGMKSLGDLTTNQQGASYARAVSADGSIVVGESTYDQVGGGGARYHAFRWANAIMQSLGDFTADQQGESYATAISADGSIVVGKASYDLTAGGRSSHAFRWTSAGMQSLGDLTTDQQGYSDATAISADGSTVVGVADYNLTAGGVGRHAFRWTRAGMQDLGDFTTDQQGYSDARAVSADGRTVVGTAANDAGTLRAFIYRTTMQDYGNLIGSLSKVGADKELAAARQQLGMQRLLETRCEVGEAGRNCLKVTGSFDAVGADGDIGRRQQTQGIITVGRGFSEQWTVGGSLSLVNSSLRDNAVDPKNAYGLSSWVSYSESGRAAQGWQMQATVGYAKQNNTITRGHGIENVQLVHGSSKLDTVAARIALGYGIQPAQGWTLTPELALTQQHSKFAAYNETQGDFTAAYKKASLNTTVLSAGLNAKTAINSMSALRLALGLEQDLNVNRMKLPGVSDIPGAESFDLDSGLKRKELRPYASAGYSYQLNAQGLVFADVGVMRDAFSSKPNVGVRIGYSTRF
ncbi:autotransporter domain-containing protein [Bordetella avium]|uniref:autotransporter domain-containing protein n=1 Tax=Bordetella avium TaxID=521 RepID=UPI000FDC09E2|nr:autotransporter domain-containing protein [Bordetella avium]